MVPTRRQFLTAASASTVAGLSGCPSDGDEDAGTPADTPADTDTPEPTPTADEEAASATVRVDSHPEHGDILVDGDGTTLYMFDPDPAGEGESVCAGDCAEAWPPLTTEADPTAGEGVAAELTTFERDDGSRQVAATGWPLYYFANDGEPGDADGQGVNDVWWVLGPDGTPKRPRQATVAVSSHPDHGDVLVDGEGRTLYMFDSDMQGEGASTCSGGCAEAWPPLTTEADPAAEEGVTAELSTFERDDGSRQVSADGWPLYYFANDEEPGDANGQGVNEVWWVLDPDGTPKRPEPATVAVRSHPDHGDILVDDDGMTLYMFDQDSTDPPSSACSGGCADSWPPLSSAVAPTVEDEVSAAVERFERDDGSSQVTAGGWPLYYYAPDESPGDAGGQGVNDDWWVLSPDGTPQRNLDVGGGGDGGGGY